MDDREIVAAIVAGDLVGLAAAYDEHAEYLHGYCRWMLSEPEDAADAVEETFIIAAGRLDGLRDPRRLRPWLYAVARNECHARLRPSEVGLGEAAEPPEPPDPPSGGLGTAAERAELSKLVRSALDELSPGEREAGELDLRHNLQGADLAAVIGVPRNQAHALASHARHELEKALGPLFVARTGRRACAELDLLLDGWDGQLDASTRKRVSRHIEECADCAKRSHGALGAAVRFGMAPLAELPPGLREEILDLCADTSPEAMSYRREVTQRAGTFLPNGFPQAVRPPRRRMVALSGVAAAVGVLVALMATGIVTVLALTGSHAPEQSAAGPASSSGAASAAGTAASGETGPAGATSPTTSAPPPSNAPPPVAPAPAPPTTAKPSPSRTAASPAPGTSTPQVTYRPPTPTPTPTSPPPSTPTPTATDSTPPASTSLPPPQNQ